MAEQVAVFVDFENVAISAEEAYGQCDVDTIIEAADQWGRCVIKHAYGDWTRFDRYRHELVEHAIELTQLFRYGVQQRKNAADIQMVVDALETAFTRTDIGVFVLVTGDSDFSAVARKLREYGKLVVGIGLRKATSEVLVKACDHFILYDTLIEPETRAVVYGLEQGRQLLLRAMRSLGPNFEDGKVFASALKHAMLQLDPTFSELPLGFHQFRGFLEAQSDLVETSITGTELAVTLKPAAEPASDGTLRYRTALDEAGLRLVDPHTRTEVLQDFYRLLAEQAGTFTLDQAVLQLKAEYDAANILRSRDEVKEVAKLVKYAQVLEPRPQSWELDPLTLSPELQAQAFVDRCESAYVAVLLQKNLSFEPDQLALLLFGTSDQRARVERLTELARGEARALYEPAGWEWPRSLKESPELQIALRDVEGYTLDEGPTVERATGLHSDGLRIRTTDFEKARDYFLRAARMMYELLRKGEPGASLMDLEWYLASYCAATAGASFFRYEYSSALAYYLAFFVLARETEPAWDKLGKLAQPMLSFYFTVAANQHGEMLEVSPGRTHPARIAVVLHNCPNLKVRERWLQLAQDLARVNPTLLRAVIQRLEELEKVDEVPGAKETRQTLADVIRAAEPASG